MCGIVGAFSRGEPVSLDGLKRATQSLYHRGPDGQRHWVSDDQRVGLGHARLSIIDLATGNQPMANEDGRIRIVVNGEFYGYEAIRQELERGGSDGLFDSGPAEHRAGNFSPARGVHG